jgi:cell filamentation protein
VYPWAGQWRQVGIAKGETQFLPHTQIQSALDALFRDVDAWAITAATDIETFSTKASELLLRLNYIHPFREGNGRTQRLFLQQWANSVGKSLNWASVGNDAMRNACIQG